MTIADERGCRPVGDLLVTELNPRHLVQIRKRLLARGLAVKTVRNIFDSSLRAMPATHARSTV